MTRTKRKGPRTKAGVEAARVATNVAKRHHAQLLHILATLEKTLEVQRKTIRKILSRLEAGQKRFAGQDATTIAVNRVLHGLPTLFASSKAMRDSAEGVKNHVTDQVGILRSEVGAIAQRVGRLEAIRYQESIGPIAVEPAARGNGA